MLLSQRKHTWQTGTAILEFAIVLWLLVFFCAATIDFGLMLEERSVMLEAAAAGAQAGAMYGAPQKLIDTHAQQREFLRDVALAAANNVLNSSLFTRPDDYDVFVRDRTVVNSPALGVVVQRRTARRSLFSVPGWNTALNTPCTRSELVTRSGVRPAENQITRDNTAVAPRC